MKKSHASTIAAVIGRMANSGQPLPEQLGLLPSPGKLFDGGGGEDDNQSEATSSARGDMMRSLYTDIDESYRMTNEEAVAVYESLQATVAAANSVGELAKEKLCQYNGLVHKLTGRKCSANAVKLTTLKLKLDSIEMQEKIWALKNGCWKDSLATMEENSELVEFRKSLEDGERQQFIFSNTRVSWGDPNETYKMTNERAVEVFNELSQLVTGASDKHSCVPKEKLYLYNALLHKLTGNRSCANNLKISTLHKKLTAPEIQEAMSAIQPS
jgi:hypothetical protein